MTPVSPSSEAAWLLVTAGILLGATFPVARLAADAGIPPGSWVFAVTAGAGLILVGWSLVKRVPMPISGRHLVYYVVTALISFVAPSLLTFAAIPRIGAGLTSVIICLSPIATLVLSWGIGARRLDPIGLAGIGLGFLGALLVISPQSEAEHAARAEPAWLGIALLIPLALAAGNVYRSRRWPAGADALALAAASNVAAALLLLPMVFVLGEGRAGLADLARVPGLVIVQILVTAWMLALFFRLQRVGGPVYLSQIGYVAAAVALASGTLVLGESYPLATWLGALVVVAGVILVGLSEARQRAAQFSGCNRPR
jgi:drug/metabolite transporter (DMT)-like permease